MSNQQKWFAIISQGRTGSNLLSRALDNRHDIQVLEEILHPNCKMKLPHEDGRRRILEAFYHANDNMEAVGMKLHVTQPSLLMPQWESAWRVIEDHDDIKLIVLGRRSVVEQLASFKVAMQTGLWGDQSALGSDRPKFRIDPEELRWFAECQRGMLQARIGSIAPARMYHVHYESLVNDWPSITLEILQFLDLPVSPALQMPIRKQEHRPLEEIILNWDEIKGLVP